MDDVERLLNDVGLSPRSGRIASSRFDNQTGSRQDDRRNGVGSRSGRQASQDGGQQSSSMWKWRPAWIVVWTSILSLLLLGMIYGKQIVQSLEVVTILAWRVEKTILDTYAETEKSNC